MFSGVRWLDPDALQEVQQLAAGLARMTLNFPQLGSFAAGALERVLAILRRNRTWWEESAWRRSRRSRPRQEITPSQVGTSSQVQKSAAATLARHLLTRSTAGNVPAEASSSFALSQSDTSLIDDDGAGSFF